MKKFSHSVTLKHKSIAQMEAEIVAMTKQVFNADDETLGMTTTGGTDSCMNAVLAYKLWA